MFYMMNIVSVSSPSFQTWCWLFLTVLHCKDDKWQSEQNLRTVRHNPQTGCFLSWNMKFATSVFSPLSSELAFRGSIYLFSWEKLQEQVVQVVKQSFGDAEVPSFVIVWVQFSGWFIVDHRHCFSPWYNGSSQKCSPSIAIPEPPVSIIRTLVFIVWKHCFCNRTISDNFISCFFLIDMFRFFF